MYNQGFTASQIAHINTILANNCIPVVGQLTWPSACRISPSFTGNEPYAFLGAAPVMTEFTGTVPSNAIQSFKMTVPNRIFVNSTDISIFDLWADQTAGTIASIAAQFGLTTVWNPEYLFYYSLLNGRNSGSNNVTSRFDGNTYSTTPDGLPIFSDNHPNYVGGTFSNIIRGSGPGTQAQINATGVVSAAQNYWSDLQAVAASAQTAMNTNGAPLFPTLNPAKNFVVIAPPQMGLAMNLALRTEGWVDATTNIGNAWHKNLIINGLASSCPSIVTGANSNSVVNNVSSITSPNYPSTTTPQLEYYVLVTGWTTGAAYMQFFNPLSMNQTFPGNYNPVAQIDALVKDFGLSPEIATSMALSLVQTNYQFLSTQSDAQVMKTKQVTVASTQLCSMFFPWPSLIYRVIPSGGTV